MALFSIYVAITEWGTDRNRAYLFIFFAVVALGMFFSRENLEKKLRTAISKNSFK